MDMGEALDTNKEMVTVGASNLMSGCLFGFTGKVSCIYQEFGYAKGMYTLFVSHFISIMNIRILHLLSDHFHLPNWLPF